MNTFTRLAGLLCVVGSPIIVLRCHFDLMRPRHGMAGGGEGECQLPSGQTIDATFANS